MDEKIISKRDSANHVKPFHLRDNVFLLYGPRNIKIESMECTKTDSGIIAFIPKNVQSFLSSKFREDKINEIWSREQRLLVEILNKSCKLPIEIKGCVLGFFVAESTQIKVKHETALPKAKKRENSKIHCLLKKKNKGQAF